MKIPFLFPITRCGAENKAKASQATRAGPRGSPPGATRGASGSALSRFRRLGLRRAQRRAAAPPLPRPPRLPAALCLRLWGTNSPSDVSSLGNRRSPRLTGGARGGSPEEAGVSAAAASGPGRPGLPLLGPRRPGSAGEEPSCDRLRARPLWPRCAQPLLNGRSVRDKTCLRWIPGSPAPSCAVAGLPEPGDPSGHAALPQDTSDAPTRQTRLRKPLIPSAEHGKAHVLLPFPLYPLLHSSF